MATDRDKLLQNAAKLVEKGKYDRAIAEYRKIVQQDPSDARTLLKIGDLQSRQRDFAGAVQTYDQVATYYASQGFQLKAIAVFKQIREIIRKQAPDLAARYSHVTPRLADIYAELNLVTDALAAYDEVATNFQRAGRDFDAIEVFKKTVALDPKNPLPHLRLAEARCRVKALDEAIDSFWTAAELLLGLRRPDDALKVIERILHFRADPVYARAAANLYLQRGNQQAGMQALSRLQIAFQANPKDLDTLALLAQAFEVINQPEKALEVHLEMARLARDQKRAELWSQIVSYLQSVAPQNEQVKAMVRAGPPPGSMAPPLETFPSQPPQTVDVVVEVAQDAVDLDEDVEYIDDEEPAPRPPSMLPSLPHLGSRSSHLPTSRPPSVGMRGGEGYHVASHDSHYPFAEDRAATDSFQPSSYAHKALADAEQFRSMGLLDKAVEALHIALEIDPNSIPIRHKLREILVEAGERDAAIQETLNIAIIHVHNQNPDAAEPLAFEVLEIEPEHPEALNILDHCSALRDATSAVTTDGALASYDMEVVRPSQAINNMPEDPAVPHFEESGFAETEPPVSVHGRSWRAPPPPTPPPPAPRLPSPSSVSFEVSARKRPGAAQRPSPEAIEEVLEEAEFFAAQGLYSDASAILSDMLANAPGHKLLQERLEEVRALVYRGPGSDEPPDSLFSPDDNAFDIAASLDALDELDEPASPPAMQHPEQEVDVDQVFAKFKEGIKSVVDDSDSATHYDLGLAYKEMGLHEDAIAEFELAGRDPSRTCMCSAMVGMIYREMGRLDQARQALLRGLLAEQKTDAQANAIEYDLALICEQEGMQRDYIHHLKSIAHRDKNYRDVAARIRALGETVPDSGDDDEDFEAAFENLLG